MVVNDFSPNTHEAETVRSLASSRTANATHIVSPFLQTKTKTKKKGFEL